MLPNRVKEENIILMAQLAINKLYQGQSFANIREERDLSLGGSQQQAKEQSPHLLL
jgi:hypothetical protein